MFSAEVENRDGSYVVEIPLRELDVGGVEERESYRIAMVPAADALGEASRTSETPERAGVGGRETRDPPVEEGEVREVEIEDTGEQGDGIARIGPGYVVFVSDTDVGDRVRITITEARDNFAFAEVVGPAQ